MMRYSRQRESILSILQATESHPTADWVYDKVRREISNISLGTVYRNLAQLEEMGQIRRINADGQSRFDANLSPHDHFRCLTCSSIFDIHMSHDDMTAGLPADVPFKVTGINLELLGVCNECQIKEIKGENSHVA
ncbi:MAG: transcriptional repressor [Candidatus Marinimicrobia bacterium]|nr:transcriptional repressor [Candidatus Neomarinimicrobiota bacterium]